MDQTGNLEHKILKRRFKEFVTLQKSLEDNYLLRSYMKNIKGPAKFLNLPIGNMGEDLIDKRKKKLSSYLSVNF